jgi:hypothetical protein
MSAAGSPLPSASIRAAVRVALLAVIWAALGPVACLGDFQGRYALDPASVENLYRPDRRDYAAFRVVHPELIEPNYLPFMVHRFAGDAVRGDALILCRWPDELMPIPVYIQPPQIPDSLQDEFHPISESVYVERVSRALDAWEGELEGLVRFQRVAGPKQALLRIRILGEEAPKPSEEIQVLGHTRALLRACRSSGWSEDGDRMKVGFRVPELVIYVADRSGMLTPNQVERVALQEMGHALGMMGHSPIPTDFMYRVVRDRPAVRGLSTEDVNSFLSLYRIPNGTRFAHAPPGESPPPPPPGPPSGAPSLSVAPHVDARRGFEVRTPEGWMRVETSRGFFAANGPIWDRDASFEVVVWPHPTIEEFLRRFFETLFGDTWLRHRAEIVVNGRRALQVSVEDATGTLEEEFTFIELGDGRVMMILSQCPVETRSEWRPWFQAALATLEIWEEPGAARRD